MSELPAGWAKASVGELLANGFFSDGDWVESKDQDPDGSIRLVQLADIGEGHFRDRSSRFINEGAAERLNVNFVEPGDVLVARMPDPIGRACLAPTLGQRAITVVDVCILRPDQGIEPRWLMWVLNSPLTRQSIAARATGTTRKRISRKNLATIGLAVPPLSEQRRIVDAVEAQFSRLTAADASVAAARRRLELLRRVSTEGLLASNAWGWTTLGEIADVRGGVTKDAKREREDDLVEVPFLRVANVQRGYLDLEEVKSVRVPKAKAEALELQVGDILFNEGGDRDKLGRGWIWEGQIERCIHQNHVFRARLNSDQFEPRFVSTHGNTWGRKWFEKNGKQTTNLASLNLTTLRRFPVPDAPRAEQRKIVAELERVDGEIARVEDAVATMELRSSALRRSILTAALSGQLVSQDSSDEPASVLLERIAAERAATKPTRKKKAAS